jgi:hypothetical protein
MMAEKRSGATYYGRNLDGAIGFSKPGAKHPVQPRYFQRLGRFAPLSFPAFGGKIQATRFAGGR